MSCWQAHGLGGALAGRRVGWSAWAATMPTPDDGWLHLSCEQRRAALLRVNGLPPVDGTITASAFQFQSTCRDVAGRWRVVVITLPTGRDTTSECIVP